MQEFLKKQVEAFRQQKELTEESHRAEEAARERYQTFVRKQEVEAAAERIALRVRTYELLSYRPGYLELRICFEEICLELFLT